MNFTILFKMNCIRKFNLQVIPDSETLRSRGYIFPPDIPARIYISEAPKPARCPYPFAMAGLFVCPAGLYSRQFLPLFLYLVSEFLFFGLKVSLLLYMG